MPASAPMSGYRINSIARLTTCWQWVVLTTGQTLLFIYLATRLGLESMREFLEATSRQTLNGFRAQLTGAPHAAADPHPSTHNYDQGETTPSRLGSAIGGFPKRQRCALRGADVGTIANGEGERGRKHASDHRRMAPDRFMPMICMPGATWDTLVSLGRRIGQREDATREPATGKELDVRQSVAERHPGSDPKATDPFTARVNNCPVGEQGVVSLIALNQHTFT